MLGTEPEIVASYVQTGKVQIVFWPVLNHGDPSIYSTLTAVCVGQQDPQLFWDVHEQLFQNQGELWGANREYYVNTAVRVGADQAAFTACYDDPAALAQVMQLDALRRQRGIFNQPTFDVNGNILAGSIAFETFAQAFDSLSTP